MKTIRELRTTLRFQPHEINSSVNYLADKCKIDYDVFLPSLNLNLQRELVWNIFQKREIIWSILMNRYIPRLAMLYTYDDVYQVIDGKQRLTSMIGFYKGEFNLIIDEKSYYFNELPSDYQNEISHYKIPYYVVNEDFGNEYNDDEKILWHKFINYAGTPQDFDHLKK